MPQDLRNTTYLITLDTAETPQQQVSAASATVNEGQYPGFVQLRDEEHRLVGLVRAERALLIVRREASPAHAQAQKTATPVPTPPSLPRATPGQLAGLAARSGKPGDV